MVGSNPDVFEHGLKHSMCQTLAFALLDILADLDMFCLFRFAIAT